MVSKSSPPKSGKTFLNPNQPEPLSYDEIQQKKQQAKEISKEELLAKVEIMPIEKYHLDRVFALLCKAGGSKTEKDWFDAKDVLGILEKLQYKMSKQEVELMIWDVDENSDKKVSRYEFELMYKRCITDVTGLEPKGLFNLVQFLMFDKREQFKITEEDTLELLFVRVKESYQSSKLDELDKEIKKIFGEDNDLKRRNGEEKEVSFAEFLDKRNKLSLDARKEQINKKRMMASTLKKNREENY